jgi:hypothetical protein
MHPYSSTEIHHLAREVCNLVAGLSGHSNGRRGEPDPMVHRSHVPAGSSSCDTSNQTFKRLQENCDDNEAFRPIGHGAVG